MRIVSLLLLSLVAKFCVAQADTTQQIVEGRRNNPRQLDKPYVILISIDGFRHDYAAKHGARFLQQAGANGTKAAYMMPAYPSLTFPNHYSIATGLYPSHHGLVDNYFFDRQSGQHYTMKKAETVRSPYWYGGTPLWALAEQNGMLSASFYWVGSEAPVNKTLPSYYYYYNEAIPMEKRLQAVQDWLNLPAAERPHLITFYFPEVGPCGSRLRA